MPYIKQQDKDALRHRPAETPGELNYSITTIAQAYIHTHGLSYKNINDVLGALEGAKLEFYRRIAAPYEDEKMKENGDVYDT